MKYLFLTLILVSSNAMALDCKPIEEAMIGYREAHDRTMYLKFKRRVHTCHNGNKSKLPSKRYADQYKSNDAAEVKK